MAILKVDYPAVLKKTEWDNKKGIGAKLAVGQTDIGARLTAIEQAFKQGHFDTIEEFDGLDPIAFAAWAKAQVEWFKKGAVVVGTALTSLNTAATGARTAFGGKAGMLVSTATKTHVQSIIDQIEPFRKLVNEYSGVVGASLLKAYRTKLRDPSNTSYALTTKTGDACTGLSVKIVVMIKQVEANPTVANLHTVFGGDGPHRMLTTSFQAWDQLAKLKYTKLAAKHWTGTAKQSLFTLPHLQDMGNENMSIASKKLAEEVKLGKNERQVVTKFCLEYSGSLLKCEAFLKAFGAFSTELKAA